eukprot:3658830-Pyramimonas_sp.AAC.1
MPFVEPPHKFTILSKGLTSAGQGGGRARRIAGTARPIDRGGSTAYDWSIVRIYPRFLNPIGLGPGRCQIGVLQYHKEEVPKLKAENLRQ